MCDFSGYKYPALHGFYSIVDEIGSGGFGKVKLAVHLLTKQNVAIKIIDKVEIGKDLPRIKTEIEALKKLSHQNICRLYQYIETEDKFYIVMEHCSGGELFDYIVKKQRLEESEARHFFRQLVQAVAYVHTMGFAHRDLKPENLLLTDELHLKVIDFGLCARPKNGLGCTLQTCCGSPAYAAPELIKGSAYFGNEADIWSMGVLLYTLLCGFLPFEDDDLSHLYRKILNGSYYEPSHLSASSRSLLQSLLQVDPSARITISDLIEHPWLNRKYSQRPRWKSIYDKNVVDEDVIIEMAHHLSVSVISMEQTIKQWRFDYYTATYLILLHLKRKNIKIALPPCETSETKTNATRHLLSSPTIHASLEDQLDKSGTEFDDFYQIALNNIRSATSSEYRVNTDQMIFRKQIHETHTRADDDAKEEVFLSPFATPSTASKECDHNRICESHFMIPSNCNIPFISVYAGISPRHQNGYVVQRSTQASNSSSYCCFTPICPTSSTKATTGYDENRYYRPHGKGNEMMTPGSLRIKKIARDFDDGRPQSSFYEEMKRQPVNAYSSEPRSQSVEQKSVMVTPTTQAKVRQPRSTTKTPRLKHRVFASLERQADKMINLLTPKKIRNPLPNILKHTKIRFYGACDKTSNSSFLNLEIFRINFIIIFAFLQTMVNVSITSSMDPERVLGELLKVFEEQDLNIELHGWKICGKKKGEFGCVMVVELEIVLIEIGAARRLVGVKRKRLCGDAFLYKKVCEQILQLAGL